MNKRGIFFTLLTIVIISLFALSYTFISNSDNRESVQKRVETLNSFVFSVEEDISRSLFVAGFRTIFITDKIILQTGQNISNFSLIFNESFFSGKIFGIEQSLMKNATYETMVLNLNRSANKINAVVYIDNASVMVSQEDPWNVKISLNAILIIEDNDNYVRWDKQSIVDAEIPIKYFEDPLYLINTAGKVTNKMIQTPYEDFVSGTDAANFSLHAQNSYYINTSRSPSFIDRLEGRTSANAEGNGIESLINIQKFSNASLEIKNKSIVDFIYFSNNNPGPVCKISGVPNWILINDGSLDIYEVRALTYGC